MSESTQQGNVIELRVSPKVITGGKRNVSYRITYNRIQAALGQPPWEWEVTVILQPQKFSGACFNQNDAIAEVQSYMKSMVV